MPRCRISGTELSEFLSFGRQPIANGFLTPDQYKDEFFFELKVGFSPESKMVQLIDQPAPEQMFHDQYAFFSGTSSYMARHFEQFGRHIMKDYLKKPDPFVLEIGSNDGIMMQHFAKAGIRHLGVEPSANVAAVAREKGVNTVSKFFNEQFAAEVKAEYGQIDAYLAANVMCHIADFNSVIAGIKLLLKPKGIVAFEDPYLGDVIKKTSYDQVYDEHVFLFSLMSIGHAFGRYDLELVDVAPQGTHGGSMRYYLGHRGAHPVSERVTQWLNEERALGLDKPETFNQFRRNCERSREELMRLLRSVRAEGKRIVGYGATSKSTTVTNYCGITPELVEFISDTTPIKQGKFSPGVHIPVRPYTDFAARYPEYALLFAWNHRDEIMAKEEGFRAAGGKWITYVPEVGVFS